jgi:glycosyltransferase involved in cell wall biosynthesis
VKPRLAVVLSHPIQYYSPWFRWLRTQASLDLRVFYLWEAGSVPTRDSQFQTTFAWNSDLLSGYEYEFVPNSSRDPGTHHFRGLRNPQLHARLDAFAPNVVLLFGYKSLGQLSVVNWGRSRRVPVIFRGDSHLLGSRRLSWLTKLFLKSLYARMSAFVYVGAANREYFRALGVADSKLFFAPHAVDTTLFDPENKATRHAARVLRERFAIHSDARVVLFAGKFMRTKRPVELLEAFLRVRTPDAVLLLVGDGEERPRLTERVRSAPAGAVHLLPFVNQNEMPALYLAADIFALPSVGYYETWGLAINEAMHMGLPALVSDRVGCQRDLVEDGKTGWVCDAADLASLDDKLSTALRAPLAPYKLAASQRILGYTYQQTTAGLLSALGSLGFVEGMSGVKPDLR